MENSKIWRNCNFSQSNCTMVLVYTIPSHRILFIHDYGKSKFWANLIFLTMLTLLRHFLDQTILWIFVLTVSIPIWIVQKIWVNVNCAVSWEDKFDFLLFIWNIQVSIVSLSVYRQKRSLGWRRGINPTFCKFWFLCVVFYVSFRENSTSAIFAFVSYIFYLYNTITIIAVKINPSTVPVANRNRTASASTRRQAQTWSY